MDKNEKINSESLKSVKRISETYRPIEKSHKIHKNRNPNDHQKHSYKKIDSPKNHKRRFSPDIKKSKKNKSNRNEISPSKHNHHHRHHKSIDLSNNFYDKNQFYKRGRYKSQDKPIKINIVSLKFRIADDFNEENSNQFLLEKDECLREVILSDEIEEKDIPFFIKNEKGSICELSIIKKNEEDNNLNIKQTKRKKYISLNHLLELFDDLK